jgi:hypothetical protein
MRTQMNVDMYEEFWHINKNITPESAYPEQS